ncbi:uncharacterized protein LOC132040712 isoform X3 [Lycium ferocissimum]|uniref:uncharacterized protein LOC132040712 isoform X3 n=1 Tax=Lycium ferocissimum TaxID=112874 RepID=UPI0028161BAD|nr:uncharacterized protein LOC132040712 isoform X3 [Lycium ferocissimum]
MKEAEEIRRAMLPVELIKRMKEIQKEAYVEQKDAKQTAAVDVISRLNNSRSYSDSGSVKGKQVQLRTRYGQFLRGNGGLPPWRNSVTRDIPHRTSTQDWILWDIHVVEILSHSPVPTPAPTVVNHSDSFASESSSPTTTGSSKSFNFSRQEVGVRSAYTLFSRTPLVGLHWSSDSLVNSPPKLGD